MMTRGQQPRIPTQVGTAHVVIVTLGQRLFAIDAGNVEGFMDTSDVVSSPVPTCEGAGYHMIDLAGRLALPSTQLRRSGQLVLLTYDSMRGSLAVERVHGRMSLLPSQIFPLPPHFQGAERDWYRGLILFEGTVAVILNPNWLFQGLAGGRQTDDPTRHQLTGECGV